MAESGEVEFLDEQTWLASLPAVVIAAGAVITDPDSRVLLVKPNYRDWWSVPGGICEFGEPPHVGCRREVAEEVGIDRVPGPLLAIDWSRPYGVESRPMMHMLFDGGQVEPGQAIVLQESELDDYRFTAEAEFADYLTPRGLARLGLALKARASGIFVYVPQAVDV
ncbi:MAG TPA: NUDIX hydrolase [Streptosporangiaceae bacterium]|nr:NUDIX hydrolase [Streptosporangiaceae bacterium]